MGVPTAWRLLLRRDPEARTGPDSPYGQAGYPSDSGSASRCEHSARFSAATSSVATL